MSRISTEKRDLIEKQGAAFSGILLPFIKRGVQRMIFPNGWADDSLADTARSYIDSLVGAEWLSEQDRVSALETLSTVGDDLDDIDKLFDRSDLIEYANSCAYDMLTVQTAIVNSVDYEKPVSELNSWLLPKEKSEEVYFRVGYKYGLEEDELIKIMGNFADELIKRKLPFVNGQFLEKLPRAGGNDNRVASYALRENPQKDTSYGKPVLVVRGKASKKNPQRYTRHGTGVLVVRGKRANSEKVTKREALRQNLGRNKPYPNRLKSEGVRLTSGSSPDADLDTKAPAESYASKRK